MKRLALLQAICSVNWAPQRWRFMQWPINTIQSWSKTIISAMCDCIITKSQLTLTKMMGAMTRSLTSSMSGLAHMRGSVRWNKPTTKRPLVQTHVIYWHVLHYLCKPKTVASQTAYMQCFKSCLSLAYCLTTELMTLG